MPQVKVTTASPGNSLVTAMVDSGTCVSDLLLNPAIRTAFTREDTEDILSGELSLSLNGVLIINPEETMLTGEECVLVLNRNYYGAREPEVKLLFKINEAIRNEDMDMLKELRPGLDELIRRLRSRSYNWLGDDNSRRSLYDELISTGVISVTYKTFMTKFKRLDDELEDRDYRCLQWSGTDIELADLILSLIEKGFILQTPSCGDSDTPQSRVAQKTHEVFQFQETKTRESLSTRFAARKKDDIYKDSPIYRFLDENLTPPR